jgi:lysozyme family protein
MDFTNIFTNTLKLEGGYANRPIETVNMGVTQSAWDAYAKENKIPTESVKNLKVDAVKPFYEKKYWKEPKIDLLPDEVSPFVFDMGVNSGAGTSIKILQKAVGAKVDGVIGKKTIAATQAFIDKNGADALVEKLLTNRVAHYDAVVARDPNTYGKFYQGWLNRISKLKTMYGGGEK